MAGTGVPHVMTGTGSPAFRYYAFISYSHQDKTWADWLHKALETYVVPKRLVGQTTAAGVIPKRLTPIFRDRDELASANDLSRKVNEALAQSANLVVICSPHSAASRWVQEEILAYERLGRGERVFCLIVDGEPNAGDRPGREVKECFAPALRFKLNADDQLSTRHAELIAADARADKDGKANAKLKVIAGMLGVGFDALKQRELRRRARRMTAVAALALVVMAVTSVLAVAALISRHDAVIAQQKAVAARRAAVVAQEAAQRRQKQAEGLVGFMLGDLNDKLRQVNRLDILQSVDDKAMAYFNSLSSKDVTDATLAMRVDALQKIGSVRQDQGQIPAALESYTRASKLAAELLRRSPSDVKRQAEYANSLTWVGYADWYQGDLAHALKNFSNASDALRKAHAEKPGDAELAFKLSSALTNAGRVLEAQGKLAAAKGNYEAVQRIFERLVSADPGNNKWQSGLGDAHDSLGKLALEQGQLVQALQEYRTNQRIQLRLAGKDASDHGQGYELLISDAILGRTLALCNQMDAASAYLDEAVKLAKQLIRASSADANLQFLFARYSEQLGGVLRQQEKFAAAAAADLQSLHMLEKLAASDPTNNEWLQELERSRIEGARLQLARHDSGGAKNLIVPALDGIATLRTHNTDDRNLVLLAMQAELVAGQLAAQENNMQSARASWEQARTLAASATHFSDPTFLATQASVLLLLDDSDAASPLLARLAAIGYQTPDLASLAASKDVAYATAPGLKERIELAFR